MRFPRERWQVLLIVAVAAGIVGIAAVIVLQGGGESPSPADSTTEPRPTGEPTTSAISLPGEGWSATTMALVSLEESPSPVFGAVPDLPQCAALQSLESALFGFEPSFAGGETRQFERQLAGGGLMRVTRATVRFSRPEPVPEILQIAARVLDGPGFPDCLLAAAARDGIVATATDEAPLPVPHGGASRVIRYTADARSGGGTVTQAVAWWGSDDFLDALFISAAGEAPTDAELASIALAAMGEGQ
jgi:hypothetical protein